MSTLPEILILDDHQLFCKGIERILVDNFSPNVKIINDPILALALELNAFDIILVDMDMPHKKGYEFVREAKNLGFTKTKFLIVSMHNKPSIVKKSIEAEVDGYILKDDPIDIFTTAINTILLGKKFYSQRIKASMKFLTLDSILLSPREEEVLRYIAKGLNSNEISKKLHISVETVKTHNRNIKTKLNIENRAELIKYAFNNLLI